jgi:hypothetical protein
MSNTKVTALKGYQVISATLSTTNPIRTGLGLNQGLHCGRPASKRLRHGMARVSFLKIGAQRKPYFYGRKWNYIYACTVKQYITSKVKNALVKHVYCVTEWTVSSLLLDRLKLTWTRVDKFCKTPQHDTYVKCVRQSIGLNTSLDRRQFYTASILWTHKNSVTQYTRCYKLQIVPASD